MLLVFFRIYTIFIQCRSIHILVPQSYQMRNITCRFILQQLNIHYLPLVAKIQTKMKPASSTTYAEVHQWPVSLEKLISN